MTPGAHDAIGRILLHHWDPLSTAGIGPDDEYDPYIAPVHRILAGSRSEEELMQFLFLTARDTIGVDCEMPEHLEQLRPIARKLLELDIRS